MKTLIQKLTSRKFIAAIAGIVTGAGVIASGNVTEGVVAVIASVVAYLVAEGYIDAKAVDIADPAIEETKDKLEEEREE
jgi:hypothetical protein